MWEEKKGLGVFAKEIYSKKKRHMTWDLNFFSGGCHELFQFGSRCSVANPQVSWLLDRKKSHAEKKRGHEKRAEE